MDILANVKYFIKIIYLFRFMVKYLTCDAFNISITQNESGVVMQHFGKSIEVALVKQGISKSQFAKDMGVHNSVVTVWISRRNGSAKYKDAILEYFNCKESEFLQLSEKIN